jgi:surfactin family lipopeptide synthetase B/lichenysin synthetase B
MFKTGDLGRYIGDQLLFCGRKDGMVKIRGQKVHMEEIDGAFRGIDGVERAVVVCKERDNEDPVSHRLNFVSEKDYTNN